MFFHSVLFNTESRDTHSGPQTLLTHHSQWYFLLGTDKSYGICSMFLLQAWLRRSPRDCESASIAASMICSWSSSALLQLESPQPAQLKQAEPQPVSLTHSPVLQGLSLKTSCENLFPFNREGNTFSGFSSLNLWCCMCVSVFLFYLYIKRRTSHLFEIFIHPWVAGLKPDLVRSLSFFWKNVLASISAFF